jgi:hypothetical protein
MSAWIRRFEVCMNSRLQVLRVLRRGWRALRFCESGLALGIERIGLFSSRFPAQIGDPVRACKRNADESGASE